MASTYLVLDQEPQETTRGPRVPSRVLLYPSQLTKVPSSLRMGLVATLTLTVCKGCALGKNTKKSFSSSNSRYKGILDMIHSDICGPMSSSSLSGCLYYVLFIDDYSCKYWIYFLKVKSETFDKFKEFKALIENQTGRHICILRSDNGGEYESNEFDDFCREAGIKRS